tara:strand:+ start:378 stop:494 length:117 start_codon:yes stop_codon:yes gene_type:complete
MHGLLGTNKKARMATGKGDGDTISQKRQSPARWRGFEG